MHVWFLWIEGHTLRLEGVDGLHFLILYSLFKVLLRWQAVGNGGEPVFGDNQRKYGGGRGNFGPYLPLLLFLV